MFQLDNRAAIIYKVYLTVLVTQVDLQQKLSTTSIISQVSLVAFYGNKQSVLNELIEIIQNYLTQLQNFIPYPTEQVHATILGCEGIRTPKGIISKWFYLNREEIRYLDCAGWLEYLQQGGFTPFDIYFAGYDFNRDYNFLSRNQHPYYRSFQLQKLNDRTYVPLLIGWAQKQGLITLELDNLRRNAQKFNFLHKYHSQADSVDNDFYLRLGTINGALSTEEIAKIENQLRQMLSKQPTTKLTLANNNLAFAQYQELSLPLATTQKISLAEITLEQLLNFYTMRLV